MSDTLTPRGAIRHSTAHVVEERGAVLDDRICWSTVAGLSLIHVAGFVGVIWIMLNPSAATLASRP